MRELLRDKTAGLDIPIKVIPNWAELETVRPMPRSENELLEELGLEDKFVMLMPETWDGQTIWKASSRPPQG